MSVLANAKHEAFARGIIAGLSGRDAYRRAGFAPKSAAVADAAASRLLHDVKVAERVAELKGQVAAAVVDARVMDLQEVLAELSKIGRGNIQKIIVAGDDTSDVVQALRDMAPEDAASIQELTIETYVEGGGDNAREVKRVKVKLHPKHPALAELRAHHEPQKHELTGKNGGAIETKETGEVDELELARRIAFTLELAARAKPGPAPAAKAAAKSARKR